MSSANEYFVENIGWLDDAAYNRELKMSELNETKFYENVTMVNASYVDTEGVVGQMDMTKEEYHIFTDRTYAAENREALEAAKSKLEERKREAGITEKPVEMYAVRHMNDNNFAVCSISADGLVTVVKPHISTIAEAKKSMLEIFDRKKSAVKCVFVHPQTLDEKSMELFKDQSKELTDVSYRINLNTDKKSSDTHILQEYIKNDNDTYAFGRILVKGDYDKCNAALAEILSEDTIEKQAEKAADLPESHGFVIYQLKGGDETRDFRFEPYDRLKNMA